MLRKSIIAILVGTAGLAIPSVASAHTDVQVSLGYSQPYYGYGEPPYAYEQPYYPPVYAYQQDDDEGYYGDGRGDQSDRQAYYRAREEDSRRHVWAWQHRHDADRWGN
jgi:hypothetical protein